MEKKTDTAVAPQEEKALTPLKKFTATLRGEDAQKYLHDVLGKKADSFTTTLLTIVSNDKNLQQATPGSIMNAAMKGPSMNLPIDANLGYAAILPYKDNKSGQTLAQFQVMRNGWMELAQRSGKIQFIANEPVHEGELVYANKFTGEFVFDENKRTGDKIIGYMAYARLVGGFEKTVYWTREECLKHGKRYSQTYKKGYGVWVDNEEAMCLKTVLKHLIVKYLPKSVELQEAIKFDQAAVSDTGEPVYVDAIDEQEQHEETVEAYKEEMRNSEFSAPDLP